MKCAGAPPPHTRARPGGKEGSARSAPAHPLPPSDLETFMTVDTPEYQLIRTEPKECS
jgi:hypothetical protein